MFKNILDQSSTYKKLDSLKIYDSLILLRDQIAQAWTEVSNLPHLDQFSSATNFVVSGMGGSALGGHIIRALDQAILKIPMEIISNYRLPAYVNENTLLIISSYSGDTEEMISCLHDGLARNAKIFVIATGGKLAQLAHEHNLPAYILNPLANPAGQPRLAYGYSITSVLALLSRCRFIHLTDNEIEKIIHHLHETTPLLERTVPLAKNPAKDLALKLKDKSLLLISANHLNGAVQSLRNIFHENAKTFVNHYCLPELNHHLLESLSFPHKLNLSTHVLMINSDLYPTAIEDRFQLTRQIFLKLKFPVTVIKPDSTDPLLQVFETLYFGSFTAYYLSLINGVDPGPIPWVNYFKDELIKKRRQL